MFELTEEQPPAWSIHFPNSTPVIELCAVMAGLGTTTVATTTPDGITLRPKYPGAPKPTGEQLRDILEHGVPRLPALVARF
jgi:hypothetical protein